MSLVMLENWLNILDKGTVLCENRGIKFVINQKLSFLPIIAYYFYIHVQDASPLNFIKLVSGVKLDIIYIIYVNLTGAF